MTQTVKLLNTKGSELGELSLNDEVFGVEPNIHVMHLALKRQLNNARQGSHNTKPELKYPAVEENLGSKKEQAEQEPVQSEVPYLQAAVFHSVRNREAMKQIFLKRQEKLALRSALSAKLEAMTVVKDFSELNEVKTKAFAKILSDLKVSGKILVIADLKS